VQIREFLFAAVKLMIGIALLVGSSYISPDNELLRGWVGMIGIVFILHFGVFHLLSAMWRAAGVTARPLMAWPMLADSVSEFWGKRWNTAFRDLTHRYLFRPLTTRFGAGTALLVGFIFSGLVHDLVISVPAHGGYGGPTVFFLIQAAALFAERSAVGRRIGLGHGLRGWAFTMAVLLAPLPLLFHPPFVNNVAVPFLQAIAVANGVAYERISS
jgi:alginate O-acetyltransferase complex protein AlgI